jgi:succinate dehydrogenase / fumarate reductase cytochrome b subunit
MAENRERPLSPHLQVWRWHVTMAGSIFHRATGVALYAGALIAAGWVLSLAAGPGPYSNFMALMGSIPGKLVLFGLTVSIFFHLANGVRHLVWDTGEGLDPHTADVTAWAAFVFAIVSTAFVWFLAYITGGL